MATIFTKIVNGEIPCHKVAETEDFLAFLDVRPLAKGHTLAIPKKENDYLFALGDEELTHLWKFAKKVALAVETAIPCKRIGVLVVGTEVPHTHIHLIPFVSESQMSVTAPRVQVSPEEMADMAARISAQYQKL